MDRACSTNREKRNAYRILVGKPEGNRPLGRQRRRWVDNIKMNLREIGWNNMGNEPSGSIKCWKVLEQLHNWQLSMNERMKSQFSMLTINIFACFRFF
jgi:hypothetical protein